MKALFLIFHGFDPNNGISKKISYQAKALEASGMEVHLCYMDETTTKKRMADNTVIADYGTLSTYAPTITPALSPSAW